jgi:hypothetical protein
MIDEFTSHVHVVDGADVHTSARERMRQILCGFHGHDYLLHFDDDRLCMRCTTCHRETPGWEIDRAKELIFAQTHRL